ncbi:MAG TPA: protein kinase [Ktedonobacterales bacterium]|nr:protein kinase [Ktedonobacterales bacterium]
MQCPQCGSLNAPGQDVCIRCGYPLPPTQSDHGNARNLADYGAQNRPGYPVGGNEPIVDGVWREEWPTLNGVPSQPLPSWLSSTDGAPASGMPSAPFTSGAPQQQGNQNNSWDAPFAPPQSGPFASDFPSQYPSSFGQDSGHLDQRGAPQQQMSPMFMVNPPDMYPPDTGIAPYGMPQNNPLAIPGLPVPSLSRSAPLAGGQPSLALAPALIPGAALKNGRYRIIQRFAGGSASGDTEPPLMIATDTELPNERVLVQELPLVSRHPEDADYVRHSVVDRLEQLSQVPGIAHMRDHFLDQNRHFLVFELPSGDRLLDRLRRAHGPLPETTVIGIILQVLDVLATLERSPVPIIHGNISPANILLRPGGQVTLVGISPTLLVYPTGQVANGPAGMLTHYSAPEQARGTADVRSDLYATCAVMHHAVTGVEPVGRMYPLARHANPAVSLELEDILSEGLRPSPSQRYQTPGALREVLAPLASGRRLTHVDEELDPDSPTGLRPLRNAQGRLMMPRQRITQSPLFFVTIVLVLVALIGSGIFYSIMQAHKAAPSTSQQTITSAFAPYYQSKGIGLSGGEFVFDTQQPDYALKQKGALAIGAGDISGALKAYQAAVDSQPSDVEALIYAEDLRILVNNEPYVTVIAGVAFDTSDDSAAASSADSNAARYEMQGIYLAQQRFNDAAASRPGHVHLRVLILNSGSAPSDAQLAANLMLAQIRQGNVQHIVGVIGWPESSQSQEAMAVLGASGMPVISPTASSNNLKGMPSNFYALVPSDSQQAIDLANAAVVNLHAHHILIAFDPNDQQESANATAFSNQIVSHYSPTTAILGRATYDGTTMQDANDMKQVAATAVSQSADLIYLVGDQRAAIFLADALAQQVPAAGQSLPHILVGPQEGIAPFFGVGSDPTSQAAHDNPNSLGLIYVATLASLSHWQILSVNAPDARTFSDEFSTLFKSVWGTGGLSLPDSLAILAYDATNMLMEAVGTNLKMAETGIVIPTAQQIRVVLGQFTAGHPFVGLGGAVSFSNSVHQPNKALGIYALLPIPNAPEDAPVIQLQLIVVIGGKAAFCGHSSCQPY